MKYLLRKKVTPKTRVHYFENGDTLCRMYSTGGLRKDKYKTIPINPGLSICTMCENAKATHQSACG